MNKRISTQWVMMVDVDEFVFPSLDMLLTIVSKETELQGASLGSMSVNLDKHQGFAEAFKTGVSGLDPGHPSCNGRKVDQDLCLGPRGHRKVLLNASMACLVFTHEFNV